VESCLLCAFEYYRGDDPLIVRPLVSCGRFDSRGTGEVSYAEVLSHCKELPDAALTAVSRSDDWNDRVERAVRQAFRDVVASGRASSLLTVFKAADVSQSGRLSASDFQAALQRAGLQLRASEVRRIVRKFDTNGDGCVDWTEFLAFVDGARNASGSSGTTATSSVAGRGS
jgi:calcium-binding protein CML